jgi:tRNA threonylcarbamoyladenosine biosynthesis protein TsaE
MMTYTTQSKEATKDLGKTLARDFKGASLITFTGDLGAGKTTLIQGILEGLGALPPYPSPTFVLMNEYVLPQPTLTGIRRVYHADAYRVGTADFEKLGFAEWCGDKEGVVLLEWPERIETLLPEKRTTITLESISETERVITVTGLEG